MSQLKKAKYEFLDAFELSADMEACEAQDSSGSHPYGIDFIDASNTCHCKVLSRTTVVRKTWLENAKEALRSLKDAECIPPEPGARTPAIYSMEAPDFGQGGAAVSPQFFLPLSVVFSDFAGFADFLGPVFPYHKRHLPLLF